jgi:hypothetical protein
LREKSSTDSSSVVGLKSGPHDGQEDQLGVGRFVQQEVGEAALAPGADQQIHVGQRAGGHLAVEEALVDLFGQHQARAGAHRQRAGRLDDVLSAAVRQRQGQGHLLAVGRVADQIFDRVARARRQVFERADHVHANAQRAQLGALFLGEVDQQPHQRFDFTPRAGPVRDAEGVKGQILDPDARGRLDRVAHRARALGVTFDPREPALSGPPPLPSMMIAT